MAVGSIWSVIAVRLSANEIIPVMAELASYWVALFVVITGAWIFLVARSGSMNPASFFFRLLCVVIALAVVIAAWHLSSERFAAWKLKSIPQDAWPKMVSDLEQIGKKAAQSGITSVSSQTPLPKSFQPLGLRDEYSGGMGNVWKSPEYTGAVASALFGYKSRSWGLCVGPESFVSRYAHKGNYVRVASNAFFFYGPRD